MSNLEKYQKVFCEVFSLAEGFDGSEVKMNSTTCLLYTS